ncbi:ABC transporter permease [Sphingobacterium sp. MYb382]|uniref:ABC transporter permease n=1 Tax=Sphingobacterium sp. MYb382 TaxID=2745278 RepID=UPI0030A1C184
MNKTLLIIQREYTSRVKKKSFLLTTFLVPLFFIGMYVLMFYLTKKSFEESNTTVYVIDQEGSIAKELKDNKNITYKIATESLEASIKGLKKDDENRSLLIIPKDFYQSQSIELLSAGKSNIGTQSEIKNKLSEIVRNHQYAKLGINISTIESINDKITVSAKEITDTGDAKESHTEIAMGISMALSVLIYLSLFLYGAQVMRGVIEEKTSRIVEVIISSVKPFQLMMGKIFGIGLVGITQFALWITLTAALTGVATAVIFDDTAANISGIANDVNQEVMAQAKSGFDISSALASIDFPLLISCFFIFFLGGYFLYSALFAAVGSAVDSETEATQFTMPITMPLLLTYILSFGVLVNDPHGTVATWLSFIPFTSPIAMLVRIPFGVPIWQIAVSVAILIVSFVATTMFAARIYRVGILMYGKKASFKELLKWFRYKN